MKGLGAEAAESRHRGWRGGRRRDARRPRQGAGSAGRRSLPSAPWHWPGSARSAAPSARRSSIAPPAGPWRPRWRRGRRGAGRPACGRRQGRGGGPRPEPRRSAASLRSSGSGASSGAVSARVAAGKAVSAASVAAAIRASAASRLRDQRQPGLGHLRLQRGIPGGIGHHVLEQPVALAHGLVIGQRRLAMAGLEAQRDAVEEPPPPLGALDPQPVHRRHQPEQPGDPPERQSAAPACRRSGSRAAAPGGASSSTSWVWCRLSSTASSFQPSAPGPAGDLVRRRPPQPAARRKQRHRLEDIGLAGPVRPPERHRPAVERQFRPGVRAELREGQRAQGKAGHSAQPTCHSSCTEILPGGAGGRAPRPVGPAPRRPARASHTTRIGITT